MKIKGFCLGQFPTFSPYCYKSGNIHFSSHSPLRFLTVFRYFGTKSVRNCRNIAIPITANLNSEKIRAGHGNINGLDDAVRLYENMTRMRRFPSVKEFNQLLSRVVNLKEYSTAICLFNDMCNLGISVDECTMNITMNNYCLSNGVDYGFSILGWFFKRGCVADIVTFNTLLKGLFRENRITEAQELFGKIVREGLCELDLVTYRIVIDGFCKAGNTAMAIELLRVMEECGGKPDIHIYTMVIDVLCKDRMIDHALKFFNEMSKKDITPNVVTYNALICGLCPLGQWKQVKILLKEMTNCRLHPDVMTFTTIIDALCKEGLVDEAEDVLHMMVQKNVNPNVSLITH